MVARGYWLETNRMVVRLRRGERKLLWKIVERLEPVVQSVVRKVKKTGRAFAFEEEDLLQIARIETTNLLKSYDPHKHTKINVYMHNWLFYRVWRVIDENLPIRIPVQIDNPELEQRAAHFRAPEAYESFTEIPEEAFVAEEDGFEETLIRDLYERFYGRLSLSKQDLYLLKCRYGLEGMDEKSLEELGRELKITREAVRVRQQKALETVRERIYLAFGISGNLKPSLKAKHDRRAPRAIFYSDVYLGELSPEPERSISAPQEWVGSLLPHKPLPKASSSPPRRTEFAKAPKAAPGRRSSPLPNRKRQLPLRKESVRASSAAPKRGSSPISSRQRQSPLFEQVVLEAFLTDNATGLMWYIRNAPSAFYGAVEKAARSEDISQVLEIRDTRLEVTLDNLAILAILSARHQRLQFLPRVCGALYALYEEAQSTDFGRASKAGIGPSWVWEAVIQRVYTIGAALLWLNFYEEVPIFIRQPILWDEYWRKRFWVAHALAKGFENGGINRLGLRAHVESYIQKWEILYEVFHQNRDNVISALCQFDFLQCIHAMDESADEEASHTSFAVYYGSSPEPLLSKIVRDVEVRNALLPQMPEGRLAMIVKALDDRARREFGALDSGATARWQDTEVQSFLDRFS